VLYSAHWFESLRPGTIRTRNCALMIEYRKPSGLPVCALRPKGMERGYAGHVAIYAVRENKPSLDRYYSF
jgi:hypothetical protein